MQTVISEKNAWAWKFQNYLNSICKVSYNPSGLHGIVSNAGILVTGDSELLPIPLFKKAMEVNFFGAVRYIQTFLPLVRQSKGTCINRNSE